MKLHTTLSEREIRGCLARAQDDGYIPADIEFDLLTETGSRSHRHGYDVHLATERKDTRADGRTRPVATYYGVRGQLRAASYDEWGEFLARLFAADPDAHARPYKGRDDFHARTRYAYAGAGEMPGDTRPAEAEPEPEYASTAATTDAMLSPDETLSRIDDALAGWSDRIVFGPGY